MSSNLTFSEKYKAYLTFEFNFVQYVLFPLGFLGGLVSIAIYLRKAFRSSAMGKYLTAQAMFQTILSVHYFNANIITVPTRFECSYFNAVYYTCLTFNNLIKTAVSLDRMILVTFPHSLQFIKTVKFQLCVIFIIAGVSAAPFVCIQVLMRYDPVRDDQYGCFTERNSLSVLLFRIHYYFDFYMSLLLPYITILISGLVVIYRLFKMKAKLGKVASKNNKKLTLARYTVYMATSFLLFNTIYIGLIIYEEYFFSTDLYQNPHLYDIYVLFRYIGLLLRFVETSSSFLVDVCFNRIYRNELLCLFKQMFKGILHKI